MAPGTASAGTFVVNSENDVNDGSCSGPHCSLREAIVAANAASGPDAVLFSQSSATGPMTIQIQSALPDITDEITLLGFNCTNCGPAVGNTATPAQGFNGSLVVAIDGSGIAASMDDDEGLLRAVGAPMHLVGLNLRNSPGSGAVWVSADGSVAHCYAGTDLSGTVAMPNHEDGFHVEA